MLAGVAMEAQGPRRVDDRVPIRKDKYRGCGEFREKGANGILHCGGEFERSALFILHCGGEFERSALFQEGRHRAYVVSH